MAEAIGLAASIIALAQLAYDSCKKLNDTIQGFRSAPEKLKDLRDDLGNLEQIMASLKTTVESARDEPVGTGHRGVLEGLKPAMEGCRSLCDGFAKRLTELTSFSDASHISKRDRIRLHFSDTEIMLLKERLLQYKLTFDIALDVASLRTTSHGNEMIEALETKVVTSLSNITGKIESLEVATQAISSLLQAAPVNEHASRGIDNLPGMATALAQYDQVLKQCLGFHTLALEDTSKLNGTTVKWISALDDAKQYAGNIGDIGTGGPAVLVERAHASGRARQYFGNMSERAALELLK